MLFRSFVGNQNSGYTGTMEVTNLDDDFAMYALGETKTDKGIIVENQNGKVADLPKLLRLKILLTVTALKSLPSATSK